jgi:hypothetical protein
MHPFPAETSLLPQIFRTEKTFRDIIDLVTFSSPVSPAIRKPPTSLQNECQKPRILNYRYENFEMFALYLKTNGCASGDTPHYADYQPKCEKLFPLGCMPSTTFVAIDPQIKEKPTSRKR